ncbi:ImmA/IrrE family metallo-endopeptidase [uncultured Bacteroides sp.]|uniref:ImmA/IrrE family metallo-endopeptidase n=1 Tax=uncultured Bacteroides sp. TaxID=162156 RepID=UPI002AA69E3F|nr:ImmA/IrrE family metallo-endopeptidase [uncultured Bacteroides sp.]
MSKLIYDLECYVQKFRQENGLGETEPIKIKSFLQKNGILTVYMPLSETFSGMGIKSVFGTDIKRYIMVNCTHSIGKQHFTICHELYHLYIQEKFESEASKNIGRFDKKGNPEEFKADFFAALLLLPWHGVWSMIPECERSKNKITLPTLVAIEQYYGCSRSALLYRLLDKGLIDDSYKLQFTTGIKVQARKLGYDISLYEKGNCGVVIGNYGTIAYKAWDKGLISESSYYSFLEDIGIDVSELDERNSEQNGEAE